MEVECLSVWRSLLLDLKAKLKQLRARNKYLPRKFENININVAIEHSDSAKTLKKALCTIMFDFRLRPVHNFV